MDSGWQFQMLAYSTLLGRQVQRLAVRSRQASAARLRQALRLLEMAGEKESRGALGGLGTCGTLRPQLLLWDLAQTQTAVILWLISTETARVLHKKGTVGRLQELHGLLQTGTGKQTGNRSGRSVLMRDLHDASVSRTQPVRVQMDPFARSHEGF